MRKVPNRIRQKLSRCLASTGLHRAANLLIFARRRPKNGLANISEAKRILVLKPDGIGDVILATGFLRSLRQQCPKAHITIAIRQASKELLNHPCFGDEIMVWNDNWSDLSMKPGVAINLARSAYKKWNNHLDWVLIPRGGWDHANASLYAWWTGCPNICAHEFFCAERNLHRDVLVNHLIPTVKVVHEIEFHRQMLRFLELNSEVQPQVEVPSSAIKNVAELFLEKKLSMAIAIGIGANHKSRCWPAENFRSLAQNLLAKWPDAGLFLIGGKNDRAAASLICGGLGGSIIDVTGKLSLSETAALLEKCDVFVGNDSGPMHLAGAVGCAVVEISKHPTSGKAEHESSPVRFGPVARWSSVLQPKALKAECREGCDQSDAHCITGVTVEQVMNAISMAFASIEGGSKNLR
jgi:heptosyltransferase-2